MSHGQSGMGKIRKRRKRLGRSCFLAAAFAFFAAANHTPSFAMIGQDETKLYVGGSIFTADPASPFVEALAVTGDKIVYAGSKAGAKMAVKDATIVNLNGAMVIPGLIDSHAHPGLVSIFGTGDPDRDARESLKFETKEEFFAALNTLANENSGQYPLFIGPWDVATFLPEGPHKREIDSIFPDRPVIIFDNSGHSTWANSVALKMLGIDRDSPDLSPHISVIVRDANGDATGWLKEFVALGPLLPQLVPDDAEVKRRLQAYLGFLSSRGVTTLYDAGNLSVEDRIYAVLAQMDRAGQIPVRYYGTYHVWKRDQLDGAVDALLNLRKQYGGERLKFETIKVHYDGVTEIHTAAMLKDYANRDGMRGGLLFDSERLAKFLLELETQGINLHIHTVGDWATRSALDAVESAQETLGRKLSIRVSLAHLEYVDPSDFPRFQNLGVSANYTPHWFGGLSFGRASFINLGKDRADQSQMIGTLLAQGANVTLSSDVTSSDEIAKSDPFLGIQMAVTRKPTYVQLDPDRKVLQKERLSIKQALYAYTRAGAVAMRLEKETGSLTVGKSADFVVLSDNIFKRKPSEIHATSVVAVFLNGEMVAGKGLK